MLATHDFRTDWDDEGVVGGLVESFPVFVDFFGIAEVLFGIVLLPKSIV